MKQFHFWSKYGDTPEEGTRNYFAEPTEVRARLNEIRRELYNRGIDIFNNKVTPLDLDKIKNAHPVKGLKNVYHNKDIIKMLNEISMEDPGSAGSESMLGLAQQGGSVSEIWQNVTGTPWSEAKAQGLTDGGYDANIELRKINIKSRSI
ncbi:MAG: hypothetical protein CM15mV42_0740 [uncultured marine virus]|nr:MAG: hypothetical protein CM15mV42_0740 [uncultured marine virus]